MNILYLLVDDDIIINMVNRRVLQRQGLANEPAAFTSAEKALHFIDSEHQNYDGLVILLDINMPELDGWGFLEEIRHKSGDLREKLKIFMLSSSIADEDISKAYNDPLVQDYLIKPLSAEKCQQLHQHPGLQF